MYPRIPARSALRAAAAAARRGVPQSTRYARYSSTMHDNDPDVLEAEKTRNLQGVQHKTSTPHKQHAPGWNEHLASASEASVKADKSAGSPADLQRTTVDYIQSRHSPDEATYLRDEVSGPLSGALSDNKSPHPTVVVKRTVSEEKREVWHNDDSTHSEDVVKAERGVLSTE